MPLVPFNIAVGDLGAPVYFVLFIKAFMYIIERFFFIGIQKNINNIDCVDNLLQPNHAVRNDQPVLVLMQKHADKRREHC